MNAEEIRLEEARDEKAPWKKWGPYLSERQWGTVREDYSEGGDAWRSPLRCGSHGIEELVECWKVECWKSGILEGWVRNPTLMAQKSLGNRWNELNGKEEEFVSAFTDFVERLYISMGELIQNPRAKASGR
jgi:hypothetical protein